MSQLQRTLEELAFSRRSDYEALHPKPPSVFSPLIPSLLISLFFGSAHNWLNAWKWLMEELTQNCTSGARTKLLCQKLNLKVYITLPLGLVGAGNASFIRKPSHKRDGIQARTPYDISIHCTSRSNQQYKPVCTVFATLYVWCLKVTKITGIRNYKELDNSFFRGHIHELLPEIYREI